MPPYNAYRPEERCRGGSDVDIAWPVTLGVRLEIVRIHQLERVAVRPRQARRPGRFRRYRSRPGRRDRLLSGAVRGIHRRAHRGAALALTVVAARSGGVGWACWRAVRTSNICQLAVPEAGAAHLRRLDLLVSAYLAGDFEIMSATGA